MYKKFIKVVSIIGVILLLQSCSIENNSQNLDGFQNIENGVTSEERFTEANSNLGSNKDNENIRNEKPEANNKLEKESEENITLILDKPFFARVLANTLNVRESFSTQSSIIYQVHENEVFLISEIKEYDDKTNWYKIEIGNEVGWISSQYCKKIHDYSKNKTVPFVYIDKRVEVRSDPYTNHIKDMFYQGELQIFETLIDQNDKVWYRVTNYIEYMNWIPGDELIEVAKEDYQFADRDTEVKIKLKTKDLINCYFDINNHKVDYWMDKDNLTYFQTAYIPSAFRVSHSETSVNDTYAYVEKRTTNFKKIDNDSYFVSVEVILHASDIEWLYVSQISIARFDFVATYKNKELMVKNYDVITKYDNPEKINTYYGQTINELPISFSNNYDEINQILNLKDDDISRDENESLIIEKNGLKIYAIDQDKFHILSITLDGEKYKTVSGLHVGMEIEECINILGDPHLGFIDEDIMYYYSYNKDNSIDAFYPGHISISMVDGLVSSIEFWNGEEIY